MAEQEDNTLKKRTEYLYRSQKLLFTPPTAIKPRSKKVTKAARKEVRATFYRIMTTIKQYNLNNESVGFKQLCGLIDAHLVSQFIRDFSYQSPTGVLWARHSIDECHVA